MSTRWVIISETGFMLWFKGIPAEEFGAFDPGLPDFGVPVLVDDGPSGVLVPVGKRAGVYQVPDDAGRFLPVNRYWSSEVAKANCKKDEKIRALEDALKAEKKQSSILRGAHDKFNDDMAWCGECGAPMQVVRPGKHQCVRCEEISLLRGAVAEAYQAADQMSLRLEAYMGWDEE